MVDQELMELAGKLTPCKRDLLTGRAEGWGSWMFEAGQHLCSLGLGTERDGSINFDTPLGARLREYLASMEGSNQ